MKYTAEEVRDYADACRLAHKGPVIADMLTKLAERIKVDESAAPVGFVMEATATRHKFGLLTQDLPPGAELFTHPPAQAAQGETSCPKCGATNPEDAATRCCPDGDSCPGCEEPLAQAWDRKAAQPAQSVNVAKVREVIAHLRSFRSNTPPTWAHLDDAADKLEAAIKGVE